MSRFPAFFTPLLAATWSAALLAGCGSGGGDSPPPTSVRAATVATPVLGQPLLFTFTGEGLDLGLSGTSAGCTNITLSSTPPNVSTASTAYFTCTPSVVGAQIFTVSRSSDGVQLFSVAYNVPAGMPTISSGSAGTPRYGQSLLFTLNGANLGTALNSALSATASGCSTPVLSTAAPTVSGPTTTYFTCTPNAVGSFSLNVTRRSDGAPLSNVAFTVPPPQVTMAMSNGGAVSGNLVITLDPARAPITVNNFLTYVNTGFYNGTIIHRNSPGFVLQGGGFAGPLAVSTTPPTPKTTNAAITLEDNTGLLNLRNTLSMARTSAPDSGTSQFFINLVDNPFLDRSGNNRGYAVFGTITAGTELVTTMAAAPCVPWTAVTAGAGECFPLPNITITSATQTR
jgi:cyclophilin family peptidyl-prolyl cis-trans isomerase